MLLNKILISKSCILFFQKKKICILYNDQIVKLYWPTKQNRVPDKVSRERTKYIAIDHSHSWTIQISVTNVCAFFEITPEMGGQEQQCILILSACVYLFFLFFIFYSLVVRIHLIKILFY